MALLFGIERLKAQRLVRRDGNADVCQPRLMAVDVHRLHGDSSGMRSGKDLVAAMNDRVKCLRQLFRICSAEELIKRLLIGNPAVVERIVEVKKDRKLVHTAPPFCFFSV